MAPDPDFAAARLLYAGVRPLGLGTCDVESFTGYLVRLGNAFAVPASILLTRALDEVLNPERRHVHYRRTGGLNGASEAVLHAANGLSILTGDGGDARRLSFHGLVDVLRLVDRDLLGPSRRWCARCWAGDAEPYDRKLWWLAVLDACHLHACLLESRCPTCARLQPSLTRGVRLHVCSYCGHDLVEDSTPLPLPAGAPSRRLLWYARQAADLVHAVEVITLLGTDESESLGASYGRLAEKARDAGLREVASAFDKMRNTGGPRAGWLEKLFSALWRLDEDVLTLFSPTVREAVRSDSHPPPSC